jgi:hypothetical protein
MEKNLQERLKRFALRIIQLYSALPRRVQHSSSAIKSSNLAPRRELITEKPEEQNQTQILSVGRGGIARIG